jgi:uncharacterized MnhB-related membrane protein
MTAISFGLDLVIVAALILLAGQSLFRPALLEAVIYFIAFSLLLALAWARLHAPDVALAEAAIGAGLTGALLLAAVRRMGSDPADEQTDEAPHGTT